MEPPNKKTGLLTGPGTVKNHNRWIYYPSKWKKKNYLSIHAEKNNLSANQEQSLIIYLPYKYLSDGAAGGGYKVDKFKAQKLVEKGDYKIDSFNGLLLMITLIQNLLILYNRQYWTQINRKL